MKDNGFRVVQDGRLGWTKTGMTTLPTVWFQCDKWGWDPRWGSTFTLEFAQSPDPSVSLGNPSRRERLGYLLEGFDALDELRVKNNAIVSRLPGTLANQAVVVRLSDGSQIVSSGRVEDPQKAVYGRDLWLSYYSMEDVQTWSQYFQERLPAWIQQFENGVKSEVGHARVAFNRVVSTVQKAGNRAEKRALLEAYLCQEGSRYFLDEAGRLLELLMET